MDLSNIENDIDIQMSPKNPIHSDIDNIDNILNLIDNNSDTQNMISFIINICNNVFNSLGKKRFNECIYHKKPILVDLYKTQYQIETKKIIPIEYNNVNVGYVESDIIVFDENNIMIIIELKDKQMIYLIKRNFKFKNI